MRSLTVDGRRQVEEFHEGEKAQRQKDVTEANEKRSADAVAVADRRRNELDAQRMETAAKWKAIRNNPGAQRLVAAFDELPAAKLYRYWILQNQGVIQEAGATLGADEAIGCIAFGTLTTKQQAVVLTGKQMLILDSKGVETFTRAEVTGVTSMPSLRGRCMTIKTSRGTKQWWEVQPDGAAQAASSYFSTGRVSPGSAKSSNPFRQSDTKSRATFVGGTFTGNVARRSPQARPLSGGTSVTIELQPGGIVLIRDGKRIAEYGFESGVLALESASSVGRGVRGRRILGAAAASLVSPVLGGSMLIGSTKAKVREAFMLCVEDGQDSGVFSLDNDSVAHAVKVQLRGTQTSLLQQARRHLDLRLWNVSLPCTKRDPCLMRSSPA